MKGQSGGLRALSVVLMTLLPIGIAFAAYLLLYVDAKRAYLTQRNFRTLGTMTRQLSEHLSAVKVAAESAAGECGDRRECLVDRLQEVPNIEIEQVVAKPTPARPGGKRRKDSEATPGPARLRWEVEPGAAGASLTLEYESLTGGRALKFYSSVRVDIRRIAAIKDGDRVIGNRTKVKIVKNKIAAPFREAEFDILYGEGISKEGDLIDVAAERNILEKSGSWFSYAGERIGQGRENARQFLRENSDVRKKLDSEVRKARTFRPRTVLN